MEAHKASVFVQQQTCWALRYLAVNDCNRVKIAEAGGIEAVVSAMKEHKTSVLMQERACVALRNLAVNDGNKLKIAEAGGIEALVAGMEAHQTSVLVQEYACWALWYLAAQGSLSQRINAAGGVQGVKHAGNATATPYTSSLRPHALDLGKSDHRKGQVGQAVQRQATSHVKSATLLWQGLQNCM